LQLQPAKLIARPNANTTLRIDKFAGMVNLMYGANSPIRQTNFDLQTREESCVDERGRVPVWV
jgi:hypothetical protein